MAINDNCPCRYCKSRYEACHSTCEEYIDWNEDRLTKKNKMRQEKYVDNILTEMHKVSSKSAGKRLRNKCAKVRNI